MNVSLFERVMIVIIFGEEVFLNNCYVGVGEHGIIGRDDLFVNGRSDN